MLEDIEEPEALLGQEVGQARVAAAGLKGLESSLLTLRVEVEAPILRLKAWEDGAALELHLGRFFSRSLVKQRMTETPGEASLTALVEQEAEAVEPVNFALLCELRDTRLTLMEPGKEDRKPYEPSTIVFGAFFQEGVQVHTEATKIRLHMDPGLLRILGQIHGGLDFALAPLSKDFAHVSPSSPLLRQPRRPRQTPAFVGVPMSFALNTSSFDIIWDPEGSQGADGSVTGHVAGFQLGLKADAAGVELVGAAQDVRLDCGRRRFLSSLGHLDVTANYSQEAIRLQISAPPLELRWAAASAWRARAALEAIRTNLQSGQRESLRRCANGADGLGDLSVSRALWDRFVAERTEELRDAWDQAMTDLSSDQPSRLSVDVALHSQELRAVLLRPGPGPLGAEDSEEVRATILGVECRLRRDEGLQLTSTLRSLEVWLGPRLLLAPRQADLPLLHAKLTRLSKSRFDIDVTWAQIALVYRQRDFERIASLCHQQLSESGSQLTASDAAAVEFVQNTVSSELKPQAEAELRTSVKYCFNIDAPLLFLPASTGKKCDVGVPAPDEVRGGLSMEDPCLAQRTFLPLPDEGFGVVDLGNCLVENDTENSQDTAVSVLLRRLQIFSVASQDRDKDQVWNQVLMPVTAKVEVRSNADCLDIQVEAPLGVPEEPSRQKVALLDPLRALQASKASQSCSAAAPSNINLTRAQATQFFDVLYLNLTYASAEEVT